MKKYLLLFVQLSSTLLFSQSTQVYNWKSVAIKGGGYVPGFVYSKAEPDLLYSRTDVGGAYRWDAINKKWICLTDAFTSGNDLGIISIAADPNDANKVYMANGLYTADWAPNGKFFISNNKGLTWSSVSLPFKVGGNEPGRGTGERLQVDPNKGNILFLGSQKSGLFKSADYGQTWNKVSSFPKTTVSFVEIDASSSTLGNATKDIYVATYDNLAVGDTTKGGIYKSADGGNTWAYIANQPVKILNKNFPNGASTVVLANNMAFASDFIYFTFGDQLSPGTNNGMVCKYNKKTGVWTTVIPSAFPQGGYSGVAVHPTNPNIVLVASLGLWWPTSDQLYLSQDGGATWKNITTAITVDKSKAPHAGGFTWTSGLKINPFNASQAVFGTGNGLFMTFNLDQAFAGKGTTWSYEDDNYEETVPLDLISPSSGVNLLSGLGDIGGFRHISVDISPVPTYNGTGNTTSLDFAENNPNKVVRSHDGANNGSYSTDQGINWTTFPSAPTGKTGPGTIAISPDGSTIVWTAKGSVTAWSTNNGSAWTNSTGIPVGLQVKSDRVNSTTFYAYEASTGKIYKSTDGAKTFAATAGTVPSGSGTLAPVFGKQGEIWIANGNGLFRSSDAGTTFTKIASVISAGNVTFGKPASPGGFPAVFIRGNVGGYDALFRSDDQGVNWKRINSDLQSYGGFTCMEGDPRIYGRLYVGTNGRGVLYGDFAGDGSCVLPLLGKDIILCASTSVTLNSGVQDAAYTLAWTKDDVSLSAKTKNIAANQTGTYRVTIDKPGCPTVYDEIKVTSQFLNVTSDTVCSGQTAVLKVAGTGTYTWFSNPTGGTSIGTGNNLSIKPSAGTYYVQDIKTTPYAIGIPAYTSGGWGLGGSFGDGQNKMQMTIESPIWLKSIALQVTAAGTKGVIRILDEAGNIISKDSLSNLLPGKQVISINRIIQAGVYLIDAVGTTGGVQFQADRTGAIFNLPGYVTLSPIAGWAWGIFFDFKFETGNVCAKTPVDVTVNPSPVITITSPANNTTITTANFTVATSVTGNNVSNVSLYNGSSLLGSDATTPYSFLVTSPANGTYTYATVAKNATGCTDTAKVILKITKTVTGTSEESYEQGGISLIPNPFTDVVIVKKTGALEYSISDLNGTEILAGRGEDQITVGEKLNRGLYLLTISDSNGKRVYSLVKH